MNVAKKIAGGPGGAFENSPAFQRRELTRRSEFVPQGRLNLIRRFLVGFDPQVRIQPSLRDWGDPGFLLPGVKTPGYFHEVPPGQFSTRMPIGCKITHSIHWMNVSIALSIKYIVT